MFTDRFEERVRSDLLGGDVDFSMRGRRKFFGLSTPTSPLVGSNLLPVGGLGRGYFFLPFRL